MTALTDALTALDAATTALVKELAQARWVIGEALDTMRELADQCRADAERAERFAASLEPEPAWAFQVRCLDCDSAWPVKVKTRETADSISEMHARVLRHRCVVEAT